MTVVIVSVNSYIHVHVTALIDKTLVLIESVSGHCLSFTFNMNFWSLITCTSPGRKYLDIWFKHILFHNSLHNIHYVHVNNINIQKDRNESKNA